MDFTSIFNPFGQRHNNMIHWRPIGIRISGTSLYRLKMQETGSVGFLMNWLHPFLRDTKSPHFERSSIFFREIVNGREGVFRCDCCDWQLYSIRDAAYRYSYYKEGCTWILDLELHLEVAWNFHRASQIRCSLQLSTFDTRTPVDL